MEETESLNYHGKGYLLNMLTGLLNEQENKFYYGEPLRFQRVSLLQQAGITLFIYHLTLLPITLHNAFYDFTIHTSVTLLFSL